MRRGRRGDGRARGRRPRRVRAPPPGRRARRRAARRSRGWRSGRCARRSRWRCSAPTSSGAAGARRPRAQPRASRREELKQAKRVQRRELERIAGLSAAQAKQLLLAEVEQEARHQAGLRLRQIEEETKLEAERRARNILAVAMQRLAATHASETTTRLVELPSDEMKGRIIGRDGRNIRALENLTGVDVIIDETPSAVVLSSFDGVRREIARLTLEKLIADGRIHPALIEETYEQARAEIEERIVEEGERAAARGAGDRARPRARAAARPAQVPHQLRPERARPPGRVLASRGADGGGARGVGRRPRAAPRCCTTSARR